MLQIIILLITFLFFLATCLVVLFWLFSLFFTHAPFIPIPKEVLPEIVKAMEIQKNSVVYDLGCGDARVLFACAEQCPQALYFGIDNAPFPITLARFKKLVNQKKQIILKRKNLFQEDLSSATHIFLYLFPELMEQLLPKLEKELKPGTKVISCDFPFLNKKAEQDLELLRPKHCLARDLYVYYF